MIRSLLRASLLASAAATLAACGGTDGSGAAFGTHAAPTICGTTDESQWVNDYDGTLGPSQTFVQSNQSPVGAMENAAAENSSKFCSGTLIANALFLTAGHCVDRRTVGTLSEDDKWLQQDAHRSDVCGMHAPRQCGPEAHADVRRGFGRRLHRRDHRPENELAFGTLGMCGHSCEQQYTQR